MTRVPLNRNGQLMKLRSGRQKAVIVGGVPIPAGEDVASCDFRQRFRLLSGQIRDEIAGKSELVRAVKGGNSRGTFSKDVILPLGSAVCFEDFEAGLRSAGLVAVDEVLVQSHTSPRKFRVQKVRVAENGHSSSSALFVGHGDDKGSPALSNCAVGRPRVKGEPVSGDPSVSPRLTPRHKLVRKKGA